MVMRLLFCLLLLSAMPSWAATKLEASVNKNPVLAGEFFILNISANDTVKGQQPDTTALLKDFIVGPMTLSSSTNIINGSIKKQTTWSVKLMTRLAGTYVIPSFSVAGLSSNPITLKVTKRSTDNDKKNDIFIKTSLSNNSIFVQEAGVYTIELYLGKELLEGSLTTPKMEDAQLSQLGKQTESYELVDGKRYLVITREYLIQPQKSGMYTIKGPTFQGRVQQSYRQLEVSALGDEQQIEIKPIPKNYKGSWLPSELVNLDEQWQPQDNSVEVGTPITRTITLTAIGVTKEQLPEISMPSIEGIKSYPDEKETNNAVRDGRIVSQQTASYALLPQKPGTYTLPEIKMPWFNTKINRISYATLPSRVITVTQSSSASSQPVIANTDQNHADITSNKNNDTVNNSELTDIKKETPFWLIIVAILGYVLWIITVIFYWVTRSTNNTTKKEPQFHASSYDKPSIKNLVAAAQSKNIKLFYDELNAYAQLQTGKEIGAIDALCDRINETQLSNNVMQLQASLYSNDSAMPDLNIIIKLLKNYHNKTSQSQQSVLKGLYH